MSAPVDVLAVLRSRFDGCDPDEGFAGGSFLHPADAKMVYDALVRLIEAGQRVVDNGAYEDFVALRAALARVGGGK